MNSPPVRWGVLSTANIGRRAVLPAIQASASGELVAVGSRDAARGRAFAEELGIPRAYASYAEVLADPEVEAVYIPLPNSLHREWAIRAAEAGKHILCEKPLALDAAECLEMAEAACANGMLLMEAFMYRFHPQTARVLELLREGAVGKPRLIRAAFTFRVTNPTNIRLQQELGGGAVAEGFWLSPDNGGWQALVRGKLVETVRPGGVCGAVAVTLASLLENWSSQQGAGVVGVSSGFVLARSPDTVRGPDVSFVASAHLPRAGVPEAFWEQAPDLAVEIVSPSETAEDVREKVRDFLAAGTPLVWVVYPRTREVLVHRPNGAIQALTEADTLDDAVVLPGFACRVGELFE